jgi:hypothetical protein
MKTFSFVPSLLIMKRVHLFFDFTKERLGREAVPAEIVDTCLQAMQEGVLDVCAQNPYGRYVWSCYTMTPDQWHRACGLLQRSGIGNLIFWGSKWFKYDAFMAGIEYLWTDLVKARTGSSPTFCMERWSQTSMVGCVYDLIDFGFFFNLKRVVGEVVIS